MASPSSNKRPSNNNKAFINKADAERWARQVEVELDKGYLSQSKFS